MSNIEVVLNSANNYSAQQMRRPLRVFNEVENKSEFPLLRLSWAEIVAEFDRRYDEVFLLRNAKAHFDFCVQVIDGAKERWRQCLLLDAILSIYCQCLPQDHRSVRRQFEHHDVFKACVQFVFDAQNLRDYRCYKHRDPLLAEAHTIPAPIQADEVDELANLATSRLQIIPPVNLISRTDAIRAQKINFDEANIILKGIDAPWSAIHMLKHALLSDDRIKKGFLKRKRIVEELCDLQILQDNGLFAILNNTVCFILADLQGPFKFRESILTRCIRQNVEPKPLNQYSKTYNNIHKDKDRDTYRETYRNSYREAMKGTSNDEDKFGDSVSYSSSSKHNDDDDEIEFDKKDPTVAKRRGRGLGKKNILKNFDEDSRRSGNPDNEDDDSEYVPASNARLDKLKILLDVVSTYPPGSTKRKRDDRDSQHSIKREDGEQHPLYHQSTELDIQHDASRSFHHLAHQNDELSRQYHYQNMMMQYPNQRMSGMPPAGMPPTGMHPGMPPPGMHPGFMGYPYPPYMYATMHQSMQYGGLPLPLGGYPHQLQGFPQPQLNLQQKGTRFNIRPGYKAGPWCNPGCLVGLYEDGLGHPTVYAHLLVVVSSSCDISDTTFELSVISNDEVTLLNVDSNALGAFKAGDQNEYLCLSPQGKVTFWDKVCPQSRIFGLALRSKTLFSETGDLLPDETDGVIGVRAYIDNHIAATITPNMIQPPNRNSSPDAQMYGMPPQMYGIPPQGNNWR